MLFALRVANPMDMLQRTMMQHEVQQQGVQHMDQRTVLE